MRIPAAISRRESLWRGIVIALGIAVIIGCAVRAAIKVEADFNLHREFGRRFVAKEFLYNGGTDFPYPPFFAMTFAPAALLPMPAAKAVYYCSGAAALLLLLWTMRRLVASAFRLTHIQAFWVTAIAVFFSIQFIIRDQAVAGLNTVIVALTWLGIYLWRQSRDVLAGLSLGAAIAIKCTPVIFLAYFLWKRQWRVAFFTAATAVLFTIAPMAWQGPASWIEHMRTWVGTAIEGLAGSGFEQQENFRVRNMALRPVLTRYLVHSPEPIDHRPSDPSAPHVLNVPPMVANWIITTVLVTAAGIFLWWSRGRVVKREDPRLLWELAATSLLMILLSPITWTQHCVALLPACYLISALLITRDQPPNWMLTVLSFYVLFCSLLGRDLIGRHLWVWLVSFHLSTFCIAGLFIILLAGPRESVGSTVDSESR